MGFNCFAVSVLYYVDMSNHMCKLHLKKYHINGDDPSPDHIPLMTGTLMNGSPKTLETSEEGMTAPSIGSGDPQKMPCFAEEEEFKSTQAAMMTIFRCLATRKQRGMG